MGNVIIPVNLHVHSEYSLLDGSIRIPDLIDKVIEFGQDAVALTDHMNLFGAINFYVHAVSKNIKPIIGCEILCEMSDLTKEYVDKFDSNFTQLPLFNLILLSKNLNGYKNLVKIVSSAYLNQKNTDNVVWVKLEDIQKNNSDIIAICSFNNSEVSYLVKRLRIASKVRRGNLTFVKSNKSLVNEEYQLAQEALDKYLQWIISVFGSDDVYIEITNNNLIGQKYLIKDIVAYANIKNLNLVASSNAHYLTSDDLEAHLVLLGIRNEFKLSDLSNVKKNVRFHVFSTEEMLKYYASWPMALENTRKIADKCTLKFEFGKFYLPHFDVGTGESEESILRRLAEQGLENRFKSFDKIYGKVFDEAQKQKYKERLNYELEVISKMGFCGYFLIVQDFINWAKTQDIPVGPGRGSGAGSLVAYALNIVDLDPIYHNLIFERFLNPERVSLPDFDVDFCPERREEVIKYVTQKYGERNVAQITTFGKMLAKGVVRDVGRVLGVNYSKVDKLAKLIPNRLDITLEEALIEEPKIKEELTKEPIYNDILQIAFKLEGLNRHTSIHAAGIIISDKSLEEYVPLYKSEDNKLVIQFEMKNAEKIGLVKFDFLGLKTLTVIKNTVNIIKQLKDPTFSIYEIPLEDSKVYEFISQGLTLGLFQIESFGMRQLLNKLQPTCFADLVAILALFRPGPLQSGMVDDFVERKHGRKPIEYPLPQLEPILQETYAIIVYQEQVQKIAAALANYTLGEADLLRRAMGKKLPEEMAKQKNRFIEGCKVNNIDPKKAEEIFDLMAKFAEYGFNKSHSTAYGLISYQTAYLKTYYPTEFMATVMNSDRNDVDKIADYIDECLLLGFEVYSPNINFCYEEFKVLEDKKISYGLFAVKGIGEHSLDNIIQDRQQNGEFKSLADFACRINLQKVGKKTLEALNLCGALDVFGYPRFIFDKILVDVMKISDAQQKQSKFEKMLFSKEDRIQNISNAVNNKISDLRQYHCIEFFDYEAGYFAKMEKKLTGCCMNTDILGFAEFDRKHFHLLSIKDIEQYMEQNYELDNKFYLLALLSEIYKKENESNKYMFTLMLEDSSGKIRTNYYPKYGENFSISIDTPVVCEVRLNKKHNNQDFVRIFVDNIFLLENFRKSKVKKVFVQIFVQKKEENLCYKEFWNNFKLLLNKHKGQVPLGIKLNFDNVDVSFDLTGYSINISNDCVQHLIDFGLLYGHKIELFYL